MSGRAVTLPYLGLAAPVALAHRGYSPAGAENSMVAFAGAVDLGVRAVETDVRVTADGVALAFHDDVLDRVCDQRGTVSRLPWRAVRTARIAGSEPIPRLDELLGAWPDLRLNLDIKSGPALKPALAAISRCGAGHRVCLGAFSDARVRRIRALCGPQVRTALSPGEVALLRAASRLGPRLRRRGLAALRGRYAQVPVARGRLRIVDAAFLEAAAEAGVAVHVWTVNEPATMRELLDLGVDGLVSDRSDLLRDVLVERGAWPPR